MSADLMIAKADAIAMQIATSETAMRYWQARDKMEQNTEAQGLFDELKVKTNASLALQERYVESDAKRVAADHQVEKAEDRLANIPVAMQYKESQAELNELVQGIVAVLYHRLASELPIEMGPKQGCGQGHDGNGCSCGNN